MNPRVAKTLIMSAAVVTVLLLVAVLQSGCNEAVAAERGGSCSAAKAHNPGNPHKACDAKKHAKHCPADCKKACCAAKKKAGTCPMAKEAKAHNPGNPHKACDAKVAKNCPADCKKACCAAKKKAGTCPMAKEAKAHNPGNPHKACTAAKKEQTGCTKTVSGSE